jgi:hypothetical protein
MRRMRKTIELTHEGKYAAEVEVELLYSDDSWSPMIFEAPLVSSR